jgi:hypothetical protein
MSEAAELEILTLINDLNSQLDKLIAHRIRLLAYLQLKVHQRDWYGVANAAMDIREVEAKHTVLLNVRERI